MSDNRIKALRKAMKQRGLGGMLVSHDVNRDYLLCIDFPTGGVLFVTLKGAYLFADFCSYEEARKEIRSAEAIFMTKPFPVLLGEMAAKDGAKKLGIEQDCITAARYDEIEAVKNIKIVYAGGIVEELRAVKERPEIEQIRKACELSDFALTGALSFIKPGVKEKEISRKIEELIRRNNGDIPFETIVASGARSSYPHGAASSKEIKRGDPVVIDFGARLNGYCSDCTRTVFCGKPGNKERKVYEIVRQAQERSLSLVREGALCSGLDKAARGFIEKKGYGKYFGHSLGHGVGRDVHELPHVSRNSKTILKGGMVITIEPGIYLPDAFGVRIEDTVLVKKGGFEVLTGLDKKIRIL